MIGVTKFSQDSPRPARSASTFELIAEPHRIMESGEQVGKIFVKSLVTRFLEKVHVNATSSHGLPDGRSGFGQSSGHGTAYTHAGEVA